MNKQNAKDYLPLVQALADGKTIQLAGYENNWSDLDYPDFTATPNKHRIKPEPHPAPPRAGRWIRRFWRGIAKLMNGTDDILLNMKMAFYIFGSEDVLHGHRAALR